MITKRNFVKYHRYANYRKNYHELDATKLVRQCVQEISNSDKSIRDK